MTHQKKVYFIILYIIAHNIFSYKYKYLFMYKIAQVVHIIK